MSPQGKILRASELLKLDKVIDTFRNQKHDQIVVGENGKDFFYDKRFDIDYQVTFNHEAEPAIKMKVKKDSQDGTVKVLEAWV